MWCKYSTVCVCVCVGGGGGGDVRIRSCMCADMRAFMCFCADITNAVFIGDKHKWFKDKLSVIPYSLYEGCEALSTAMLQEKSLFFDSDSDSDSLAR